jgi:hypothetical protein
MPLTRDEYAQACGEAWRAAQTEAALKVAMYRLKRDIQMFRRIAWPDDYEPAEVREAMGHFRIPIVSTPRGHWV